VLPDLIGDGNAIIRKATMLDKGKLTAAYDYLKSYALH
jgi:hypothetical protein